MTLTLSYTSPGRDVTQNSKHYYVTSPSLQMRMEDGWITILDPIDDMMMVHSVDWAGDNEVSDETQVRIAWVSHMITMSKDALLEELGR